MDMGSIPTEHLLILSQQTKSNQIKTPKLSLLHKLTLCWYGELYSKLGSLDHLVQKRGSLVKVSQRGKV